MHAHAFTYFTLIIVRVTDYKQQHMIYIEIEYFDINFLHLVSVQDT